MTRRGGEEGVCVGDGRSRENLFFRWEGDESEGEMQTWNCKNYPIGRRLPNLEFDKNRSQRGDEMTWRYVGSFELRSNRQIDCSEAETCTENFLQPFVKR